MHPHVVVMETAVLLNVVNPENPFIKIIHSKALFTESAIA